jgi:hypothetical protein
VPLPWPRARTPVGLGGCAGTPGRAGGVSGRLAEGEGSGFEADSAAGALGGVGFGMFPEHVFHLFQEKSHEQG